MQLIPATITVTVHIPAVSQLLEYLQSLEQNAKKVAELTAQLKQSSGQVQTAVDAQTEPPTPSP